MYRRETILGEKEKTRPLIVPWTRGRANNLDHPWYHLGSPLLQIIQEMRPFGYMHTLSL